MPRRRTLTQAKVSRIEKLYGEPAINPEEPWRYDSEMNDDQRADLMYSTLPFGSMYPELEELSGDKMYSFYLGSGFNRRYHLRQLRAMLEQAGHRVTSRWIDIEERPDQADPNYDFFAGKIAAENVEDLKEADILVIDSFGIMPDNNGGVHFEFGYMEARQKPIFLIGKKKCTFHWLPSVVRVEDYSEFMSKIDRLFG